MNKIYILACLFVITIAFSDCSRKDEKKVVLKWYYWYSTEEAKVIKNIAMDFESTHPSIKVQLLETPWSEYKTKLQTMLAGDVGPDIFMLKGEWVPGFTVRGMLLDLAGYINKDQGIDLSDFYPNILELGEYNGVLYGIPFGINFPIIFYNKDLFDEARITYPANDWTWHDFLDKALALTQKDNNGGIKQYGFADMPWSWIEIVWQNGGELFNNDMTECTVDSPEAVEALQFWGDLWQKHKVMPTLAVTKEQEPPQLFFSNKAAMMRNYPFWMRSIKNFRWDIAPVPKWKKKVIPLEGGVFSINRNSKHKEAAYEFLKYFNSNPVSRLYFLESQNIPTRKSLMDVIREWEYKPQNIDILFEEVKFCRKPYAHPSMDEIMQNAGQILDMFWVGKEKDAGRICRLVKEDLDKRLKAIKPARNL